ncbi:diacylglycerol/lipid kinase family protein [Streptomyces triticisoli]|uniref:diacylglycerol/lipid kinase family protein n=1 Tax=Streptomyces triticisoli TaxID=2182797 RepID=UPI003F6A10E2
MDATRAGDAGSARERPAEQQPAGHRGAQAAWARLALLALLAAVLLPLAAAGVKSVFWLLAGVAGLTLTVVALWWTVAYARVVRATGLLLAVTSPLAVLALYAANGMLAPACLSLGLLVLAVAAARIAVTPTGAAAARACTPRPTEAPRHPWILMNPRSGGGKVDRFGLAEKAGASGADVVLLDPGLHQDVAELARRAVDDGADLLAVAGGDGTQALVAEVAARHDLPFLVIPAGTRNHFALDLGLDREDPAAALEALTDGVEVRVDLGYAADRVFVNNASFGTYAAVVRDPAYRDEKLRTTLQVLPGLLTGPTAPRLRIRAGAFRADGLQALLVSNNPYRRAVDSLHPGRRESLNSGRLGVLCVRVDNSAQAADLLRGPHSSGVTRITAPEVVVEADAATVPAGIDGEPVLLPAPVVCRIAPGALRVRLPRRHTPTPTSRPPADWPRVLRLALPRCGATGRGPGPVDGERG